KIPFTRSLSLAIYPSPSVSLPAADPLSFRAALPLFPPPTGGPTLLAGAPTSLTAWTAGDGEIGGDPSPPPLLLQPAVFLLWLDTDKLLSLSVKLLRGFERGRRRARRQLNGDENEVGSADTCVAWNLRRG
uniref:Uncharacterized protein n=1 Tax=Oryza glumipatula TaxID=40148 RepID=A0A0D9Y486_9ORYZ